MTQKICRNVKLKLNRAFQIVTLYYNIIRQFLASVASPFIPCSKYSDSFFRDTDMFLLTHYVTFV
jgi:hypothetical protein